jgi:3-oxoacyl-[acyl-carrier-protein] synthase-3
VIADAGLTMDDIRVVVPHQASGPGINALSSCGVPSEKVVNVVGEYGNCVAASIPMALAIAHREGRLKRGEPVLIVGTGAGLSIGAAVIRW